MLGLLHALAARADELPVEVRRVDRGGWSLHAVRVGPPDCTRTLLALHGGPGLAHGALRSLDGLAGPTRCVIYFDQRGVGESDRPDLPWSADDLVADVEAVRTAFELTRMDLIGHSWGAYLAALYVSREPRRVRRLVYSSPAPLTPGGWAAFERAMRERIRAHRDAGLIPNHLAPSGDDCSVGSAAVLPAYLFDPEFHPEDPTPLACSSATYAQTWAALPKRALAGVAGQARHRATLVQGEGEATRQAILREWTTLYRGSLKLELIPACGHVLHTECPDAWLAVLTPHL